MSLHAPCTMYHVPELINWIYLRPSNKNRFFHGKLHGKMQAKHLDIVGINNHRGPKRYLSIQFFSTKSISDTTEDKWFSNYNYRHCDNFRRQSWTKQKYSSRILAGANFFPNDSKIETWRADNLWSETRPSPWSSQVTRPVRTPYVYYVSTSRICPPVL